MVFMKFHNANDASDALKALKDKVLKENYGKDAKDDLWCEFEAPIEKRVCTGFLRSLRNQLIEWKFPKECIEIPADQCVLKVEKKEVVMAAVTNGEFDVTWTAEAWSKWPELQTSQELATMIQTAKERLAKSRAKWSKGAGKGLHQ